MVIKQSASVEGQLGKEYGWEIGVRPRSRGGADQVLPTNSHASKHDAFRTPEAKGGKEAQAATSSRVWMSPHHKDAEDGDVGLLAQ